jgi:hypothetical protein
MNRKPVVAGQFYPGDPALLDAEVQNFLSKTTPAQPGAGRTLLAMVPHAGYMFSGEVCGRTLRQAVLPGTVVLLGPNHTGLGERIAVWSEGTWEIPGAAVPVNEELGRALLEHVPGCTFDPLAHKREHSLEVVLPFLRHLNPATRIVPVAVSEPSPETLVAAGLALGKLLSSWDEPVSMIVSSDMSHYVSQKRAHELDHKAVDAVLTLEPGLLYQTVRQERITMCGVLPMTLALSAAVAMGASSGRLTCYATSADVTGDLEQVVGYAGILVE